MMREKNAARLGWALVLVVALAATGCVHRAPETALDRYVKSPDAAYAYEEAAAIEGKGYTAHVLRLTSQQWRTAEEVDRPVWKHWLTLVCPDEIEGDAALLFVGGGHHDPNPPGQAPGMAANIAVKTKSVVAHLSIVPNEPLVFTDENGRKRSEDAIIAYTFDKYYKTGDETWPLLLPMVKSAVRAMDATQSFLSNQSDPVAINRFVVTGGSKRGWTTWLTGAVDDRVVGIIPAVIDVLNMERQMNHQLDVYGDYAPVVGDYVEMKVFERFGTPRGNELLGIVDPISYNRRYDIPKFMVNSAGDQFFLPDSTRFYYDELRGPKYLRYVPNTDHGLGGSDAAMSLASFYWLVTHGEPIPSITWRFECDGSIRVKAQGTPAAVKLWQATVTGARDFRLETIGKAWRSSSLEPVAKGEYVARVPEPEEGWTGFFVEFTYRTAAPAPLKLTTAIRITPDTLPYAE